LCNFGAKILNLGCWRDGPVEIDETYEQIDNV